MNNELNVVVFSRNRAMQLDLLLTSFKQTFREYKETQVNILYDFTDTEFYDGYEILKEYSDENIKFITDNEFGSFKQTILNILDPKKNLTMFLCDDIVFTNDWSLSDKEIQILEKNESIIATSLRLWEGINFCYATRQSTPPPKLENGIWNWTKFVGDWGYPMSVDGNVYKTEFILSKINEVPFKTPNELESALAITADRSKPNCCCYVTEPKLFNIPANIVQTVYQNRHGNIKTANELNYLFLSGKRLDEMFYRNKKFNTVHVELELKIKD
jgi:translation elongation factor P/translation initiation factor 5A